jgi:hypothetical protein
MPRFLWSHKRLAKWAIGKTFYQTQQCIDKHHLKYSIRIVEEDDIEHSITMDILIDRLNIKITNGIIYHTEWY